MAKPSKQQMAAVRSALREIHAELLGWDPHVLVAFSSEAQKTQIIERMHQLGWHYVNDPNNETTDVSMVEFSLDPASLASTGHSAERVGGGGRRWIALPPPFFASMGVIAALVGILMAATASYTDYRMNVLNSAGAKAIGEIENTYFTSGRGGNYVTYRFIDSRGISHVGDEPYPFQDWNSLRHGAPISVTYLADDPQRNDLTQRVQLIINRNLEEELILIGAPWAVAGCFFLAYWARKRFS